MRSTLVVLVAVLAVLAGCGAGGPATTDATPTEATTAGGTTEVATTDAATTGGTTAGTGEDRTTTGGSEGTGTTDGGSDGNGTTPDGRAPWPAEDGPPRVETVGGDRPDLDYSATRVLRRVERLRGLDATDDVRLTVDLPPLWIANNRTQTRDLPDEAYGIRPPGAIALQLESDAATRIGASSGVAKAINPRVTETVNVWEAEYVRQIHNESQRLVLAHEFVHVLQFQNDLSGLPAGARTTDEFLVGKALREGDAVLVHEQYRDRYDLGGGGLSPDFYNVSVDRPSWNADLGNLAYYHGYRFYVRATDSPGERTGILEDPPSTTAALLHPGSVPEDPVGDPAPPPVTGWVQYGSDRVGELAIRVAFRANGVGYDRAAEAAAGWRHDRMVYLRQGGEDGPAVVLWRTVWANGSEAREFATAWRSMLRDGLNATVEDGLLVDDGTRTRPKSVVHVRREGATVDVVTGSDRESVRSVLEAADLGDPEDSSG